MTRQESRTVYHTIGSADDLRKLSYYTLCRISDKTMIGTIEGIACAIQDGRYNGNLKTDGLGNYLSFD